MDAEQLLTAILAALAAQAKESESMVSHTEDHAAKAALYAVETFARGLADELEYFRTLVREGRA